MSLFPLLSLATALAVEPPPPDPPADALPFLRGVSVEKPTQLAFEHEEYDGVDWAACKEILAEHYKGPVRQPKEGVPTHAFGPMDGGAGEGQRHGDRAACMAAAAMKLLPELNVLRIPIEPGIRHGWGIFPIKVGDHGIYSRKMRMPPKDYLEDLVNPILDAVAAENDRRDIANNPDRRVWVILDWHYVAAGDGQGGSDRPWPWVSVRRTTHKFWEMASALYGGDGLIFEVFNEPVLPKSGTGAEKRWTQGLAVSIDALKAAGATHIVVGAPRWSGRGEVALATSPLMQAEHCYTNKRVCRGADALKPKPGTFATEVGADDGDPQGTLAAGTAADMDGLLDEYEACEGGRPKHVGWVAWVFAPETAHTPSLLTAPQVRLDAYTAETWTEWGRVVHQRLGAKDAAETPVCEK